VIFIEFLLRPIPTPLDTEIPGVLNHDLPMVFVLKIAGPIWLSIDHRHSVPSSTPVVPGPASPSPGYDPTRGGPALLIENILLSRASVGAID